MEVCKKEEYINIQTGEVLDWDRVEGLKDNAMLKVKAELWCEWDFEKNDELGFDIWKMTKGSHKKAWWVCKDCKSLYNSTVNDRTRMYGCPYCRGLKVNHSNSLASICLELASQWHPTKNGSLTPHDVTSGSGQKVWWNCKEGHEWEALINDRKHGAGCAYCSGNKVLKGFNDMWTTNPQLAKLLHNPEDGYKYTQGSNKKVDWKCLDCGEIIKNKAINNIKTTRLSCPKCSDGVSYPEKLTASLLENLGINFSWDISFPWSNGKRYDFYIPSLNIIIETHGKQHYKQTTRKGARTLEEEQSNDKYKYELAMKNNIKKYIEIDARESDFEFIKNNILQSKLNELFDLSKVEWEDTKKNALNSLYLDVISKWNSNDFSNLYELSKKVKLSVVTVRKYLKIGDEMGDCNYEVSKSRKIRDLRTCKEVVCIGLNSIKTFNSLKEASNCINHQSTSNISSCLKKKRKSAGGYRWMYKEDYDKYIEDQNKIA